MKRPETFDFVIVGGGLARGILTRRLSEDFAASVLLLEAGPTDAHWTIRVPGALRYNYLGGPRNWALETESEPWMDDRCLTQPRGKIVGGSSSVNGMVYVRSHARYGPLGRATRNRVVLRRGSPLLQETRALSIRPRRVPRWRRTNRGAAAAGDSPHRAGVSRCRRAGRLRAERGLQRRGAGRVHPVRRQHQGGAAVGHAGGVHSTGRPPFECNRSDARSRDPGVAESSPCGRSRIHPCRTDVMGACGARGHTVRWRLRVAVSAEPTQAGMSRHEAEWSASDSRERIRALFRERPAGLMWSFTATPSNLGDARRCYLLVGSPQH